MSTSLSAVAGPSALRDGAGSERVVTGNHHRPDACSPACGSGVLCLQARRIDQARQADELEIPLEGGGVDASGQIAPPP